jgi:hypothetical protein
LLVLLVAVQQRAGDAEGLPVRRGRLGLLYHGEDYPDTPATPSAAGSRVPKK